MPKKIGWQCKKKIQPSICLDHITDTPTVCSSTSIRKKHARVFNKICLLYVWGNKQQVLQVFFTGRSSPLDYNNQRLVLSKVSTAQLEWHKFLVKSIAIRQFFIPLMSPLLFGKVYSILICCQKILWIAEEKNNKYAKVLYLGLFQRFHVNYAIQSHLDNHVVTDFGTNRSHISIYYLMIIAFSSEIIIISKLVFTSSDGPKYLFGHLFASTFIYK